MENGQKKVILMNISERIIQSLIFTNVTSTCVFLQKLYFKLTDILSCVLQTHKLM